MHEIALMDEIDVKDKMRRRKKWLNFSEMILQARTLRLNLNKSADKGRIRQIPRKSWRYDTENDAGFWTQHGQHGQSLVGSELTSYRP